VAAVDPGDVRGDVTDDYETTGGVDYLIWILRERSEATRRRLLVIVVVGGMLQSLRSSLPSLLPSFAPASLLTFGLTFIQLPTPLAVVGNGGE
jgi:hypothetical protein